MNKTEFVRDNFIELKRLYDQEQVIADAVRQLCEKKGIKYNDAFRKRAGEVLREHYASVKEGKASPARVFIFDIETAPMRALIWSLYQKGIGLHQLQSDWFMISWAGKYLFEEKVYGEVLTPEEILSENDKRITRSLWEHFENADILIAHNGKKFDIRRVNTRFLKWGIHPPMPYQIIDTLLHMRKQFSLASNKLDYIARDFFGFEGKVDTGGMDLWVRCLKGEKKALQKMLVYNIKDVHILEEVYLQIRPWIKPHPNIGLFLADGDQGCPSCGSSDLTISGEYNTYANTYPACRCNSCGAIGRLRKASTDIKKKQHIVYSVPV